MSHCVQTTLFRQRLEKGLCGIVNRATRIPVMSLPATTRDAMVRNAAKLRLFSSGMDEEERELVLDLLNSDWSEPFESMQPGLVHMCRPHCCKDRNDFEKRLRSALQLTFGDMFQTPLLYRWKAFEPAAEFTARGLAIHGLLPLIWGWCRSERGDAVSAEDVVLWDEDQADTSPAFKQKVRMSKVQVMLNDESSGVFW